MKNLNNFKAIFLTAILCLSVLAAAANVSAAAPGNDNLASPATISFDGAQTAEYDFSNTEATREATEPNHYNPTYPGEKTVWYKWTATADTSVQIEMTAPAFDSLIKVYRANALNPGFANLSVVVDNLSNFSFNRQKNRVRFRAVAGTTYYIVAGSDNLNQAATEGPFHLKFELNKLRYSASYHARVSDKTSLAVYRPNEGDWYIMQTLSDLYPIYTHFGLSGATPDQPLAADFNGDGFSDMVVTRNEGGLKYWYANTRFNSAYNFIIQWGLDSDKAVTGDFDRDGLADLAVIRNTGQNLVWYIRQSSNGQLRTFVFGQGGDKPVLGDFDGDGATDVAVTRLVSGSLGWHILKSGFGPIPGATYGEYVSTQFGAGNDLPAAEDYDGDGKTDLAVFRPVTGNWIIRRSGTNEIQETHFGQLLDKTQPGDYDGDGKADLALYRPSEGRWYLWLSGTDTQTYQNWGAPGDIPVSTINSLSQ